MCLPVQETQETQVQLLDREDLLGDEMANHSSILTWKVPWLSRGAWWATVHGVLKSWTQLCDWECMHQISVGHFKSFLNHVQLDVHLTFFMPGQEYRRPTFLLIVGSVMKSSLTKEDGWSVTFIVFWKKKKKLSWDFCGSPEVKTLCFHCSGHGFHPWLGN